MFFMSIPTYLLTGMEADTSIINDLANGEGGSKVVVDNGDLELTDTDLSQKIFYEGITKLV
jgi:hypothetical protein